MVISSAAAANSMRRMHEAFERRNHEAAQREQRRREEENRRREEEHRRNEEESRRREEEHKRQQNEREQKKTAQQHHQDLSQTFSYASAPANFSEKYLFDKEEIYKAVISYDGYEYGCADGSSIVKNDINHCVKRLSDGTTQTYQLVYERRDGTKYLLQREELSDGRVRVYDTKCRIRNYNELQKTYTDEEDKYYVMYERKADKSYKRYDITDEKEDENYSYTVYKTKLVESYTSPEKIRKLSEKHRPHLMPGF